MISKIFSIIPYLKIFGGVYLGWGIGANDSANVFGASVTTKIISYKSAVILLAIFVVIGSVVQGPDLFLHLTFSDTTSETAALIATLAAAFTVTIITVLAIPSSTSQAAIGALMGIAISSAGFEGVEWKKFSTMLFCWLVNPIMAIGVSIFLLKYLGMLINKFAKSAISRDRICYWGLVIFGCYGAYALGANNVVVTTSAYFHAGVFGSLATDASALKAARIASLIGGLSIALGSITYSYKVMTTIGGKVTPLYPFSALVVVITGGVALDFFTRFKVPVSSSQAVVGALIGVSLYDYRSMGNIKELIKIFCGWILTPIAACLGALLLAWFLHYLHISIF